MYTGPYSRSLFLYQRVSSILYTLCTGPTHSANGFLVSLPLRRVRRPLLRASTALGGQPLACGHQKVHCSCPELRVTHGVHQRVTCRDDKDYYSSCRQVVLGIGDILKGDQEAEDDDGGPAEHKDTQEDQQGDGSPEIGVTSRAD